MSLAKPFSGDRKRKLLVFMGNGSIFAFQTHIQTSALQGEELRSDNGNNSSRRDAIEFCKQGRLAEALNIVQHHVNWVDSNLYASLLTASINTEALAEGKIIHSHIIQKAFVPNAFLGTKIVLMYVKCKSLVDARRVLDELPKRDVVSWTAMIAAYSKKGFHEEALALFHQMQETGVEPDQFTIASVLQACANTGDLQQGKDVHEIIIRKGLKPDVVVGSALVDMYVKCGSVEDARNVFDNMPERNVVSWTAMVSGYTQNGFVKEARELFEIMPERNIFSWNAMIAGYAQNGQVDEALEFFQKMPKRDLVSWSTMIAGFSQNAHFSEALKLFRQMQGTGMKPNPVTYVSILPACANSAALQQGKEIHEDLIRNGLQSNVNVTNAVIDMYTKCGCLEIALKVFDEMCERDVVSWNAMITGYAKCGKLEVARHLFDKMPQRTVISWTTMIAGYVQNGHFHEALELYGEMQQTEFKPNRVTLVSVLPACAHLGALQQGKTIHDYIIRRKLETDVSVVTALINMYAKCGQIDVARELFDKMYKRDAISWNAMIAGYGMHGQGEAVVSLFVQMQQTGVKPDDVTLVGVLSACSHAGLVEEGLQYFHSMNRVYGLVPKMEHYACMVDLLSRAGRLDEARDMIAEMPFKPSPSVWGALLSACRTHGKIELGEYVARHLFEIEPHNTGNYVLLSNIYADAGRWDDVMKIRIMLKERGLKKSPGCSWVEVNNRAHGFIGGDRSHPQSEEIYTLLENLGKQMKKVGYLPDTSFVLHDVAEEEKEFAISTHSERLAIAFGILNTAPGTPIQITKNLRVCGDCHTATKFISKIVRREITVRDINRFHHFKDGLCSCGDYW